MPMLELSLSVIDRWRHRQTIVDACLQLFANFTRRVAVFLESAVDCQRICQCLLALIELYARDQAIKYQRLTEIEEDKAGDLVLFIDILTSLLSRDVFVLAGVGQFVTLSVVICLSIVTERPLFSFRIPGLSPIGCHRLDDRPTNVTASDERATIAIPHSLPAVFQATFVHGGNVPGGGGV